MDTFLNFSKNNFNIDTINSELKNFCSTNGVSNDNLLKLQLISEEFLSNILFPNFEDEVLMFAQKNDQSIELSFEYKGENYMNKINETTMLSLKILENKTEEIISDTKDGKTSVIFIV